MTKRKVGVNGLDDDGKGCVDSDETTNGGVL